MEWYSKICPKQPCSRPGPPCCPWVLVRRSSLRSRLHPCEALWLETCVICVAIPFFQLLDFPSFLNCCSRFVSNRSLSLLLHEDSRLQIRKGPQYLILLLVRQVSMQLTPSHRQGVHLAPSPENSTLRWISNFSHPAFRFRRSCAYPDLWMQSNFSRMRNFPEHMKTGSTL